MSRKPLTDDQLTLRRKEILDAAMQLFESSDNESVAGGIGEVSFRKVAAILGSSYTMIYRYFPNKGALVNAMRARAFTWIKQEMQKAIVPNQHATLQLESVISAYIRSGTQQPQRYALMYFDVDHTDASKPNTELLRAKHDALHVCVDVLAAGRDAGEFHQEIDPLTAAHLCWVGAHGIVSLHVSGQLVMGREIDQLQPMLIGALRSGLGYSDYAETTPSALANTPTTPSFRTAS